MPKIGDDSIRPDNLRISRVENVLLVIDISHFANVDFPVCPRPTGLAFRRMGEEVERKIRGQAREERCFFLMGYCAKGVSSRSSGTVTPLRSGK